MGDDQIWIAIQLTSDNEFLLITSGEQTDKQSWSRGADIIGFHEAARESRGPFQIQHKAKQFCRISMMMHDSIISNREVLRDTFSRSILRQIGGNTRLRFKFSALCLNKAREKQSQLLLAATGHPRHADDFSLTYG